MAFLQLSIPIWDAETKSWLCGDCRSPLKIGYLHAPTCRRNPENRPAKRQLVTKRDVAAEVANALMRLGKNDWDGFRYSLQLAGRVFEEYMDQHHAAPKESEATPA